MKSYKALCLDNFDPCYGFNPIEKGEVVELTIHQSGDIRLSKSERNLFPGFGYKLYESELNEFFKIINR